jgi:hypothetical protein
MKIEKTREIRKHTMNKGYRIKFLPLINTLFPPEEREEVRIRLSEESPTKKNRKKNKIEKVKF